MPRTNLNNVVVFLYALLLTAVGALAQLTFALTIHEPVDAALSVLIALAFFVGPLELGACGLGAFLLLAWRPNPSPELALFIGFPIAFFFIRQVLPWRSLVMAGAAAAVSIGAFYFLLDYRTARAHLVELAVDVAISICIAVATYAFMKRIAEKEA